MTDITLLTNKAIKMALNGKWKQAVVLNLQILDKETNDLQALLRLAKAYTNLNQIRQARKTYRQVLSLDKYNPIAKRNLKRLKKVKNGFLKKDSCVANPLFLEEPGKTKTISLVRLTDGEKLATLEIGELVALVVNPKSLSVVRKNGQYLGRLPDDIAFRLIHLIRGGNKYQASIRSVEKDRLQIFVTEIKKGKGNEQILSFPPHPLLPPQMLGEQPPLVIE